MMIKMLLEILWYVGTAAFVVAFVGFWWIVLKYDPYLGWAKDKR